MGQIGNSIREFGSGMSDTLARAGAYVRSRKETDERIKDLDSYKKQLKAEVIARNKISDPAEIQRIYSAIDGEKNKEKLVEKAGQYEAISRWYDVNKDRAVLRPSFGWDFKEFVATNELTEKGRKEGEAETRKKTLSGDVQSAMQGGGLANPDGTPLTMQQQAGASEGSLSMEDTLNIAGSDKPGVQTQADLAMAMGAKGYNAEDVKGNLVYGGAMEKFPSGAPAAPVTPEQEYKTLKAEADLKIALQKADPNSPENKAKALEMQAKLIKLQAQIRGTGLPDAQQKIVDANFKYLQGEYAKVSKDIASTVKSSDKGGGMTLSSPDALTELARLQSRQKQIENMIEKVKDTPSLALNLTELEKKYANLYSGPGSDSSEDGGVGSPGMTFQPGAQQGPSGGGVGGKGSIGAEQVRAKAIDMLSKKGKAQPTEAEIAEVEQKIKGLIAAKGIIVR
jgi:hypothetical protein